MYRIQSAVTNYYPTYTNLLPLVKVVPLTLIIFKRHCRSLPSQITIKITLKKVISSLPTAASKRLEIMRLYDSITSGVSQYHVTGNEKNCSGRNFLKGIIESSLLGGWYTFVCSHGCIYGSKLLFLSESVRDAGRFK